MSGETTAVKQRCAKCGLEIDNFAANPGLWPIWTSVAGDNGATKVYHQQCVIQTDELERLRADNERLRGERDEANLFRERNRVALNQRDSDNARLKSEVERWKEGAIRDNDEFQRTLADLQAHKAALEKARVALDKCDCFCGVSESDGDRKLCDRCQGLATINELLQKGSK